MLNYEERKQSILQQLQQIIGENLKLLWDDNTFREYYSNEMSKEIEKVEIQLNQFFDTLQYFTQWYSKDKQYSFVLPRKGGKYSLFCYTCRRWIPNTANYEMRKEGFYSHEHFCVKENGVVKIYAVEGIPEDRKEELI